MPSPQHVNVVSCLVRNRDGSILCVKHKIRGWEMPQGRVEQGEAVLEALHREVMEETGVTIDGPKLAAVWSKLSEPQAVIHGFVAEHVDGDPTPSEETPEVAWFSAAEAQQRVEHPVNRDRLRDLLAFEEAILFASYTTDPYRRSP